MKKDEAILQAAEDALAYIKEKDPLTDWHDELKDSDLLMAVKIFNAGYEFANRWSVIDRDGLPTDQDMYLVTVRDEYTGESYTEERWFSFTNGFRTNDVIAWRPMPEPYKEAE